MVLCTLLSVSSVSGAQKYSENNTKIKQTVSAVGRYSNWDGVSNVTQFQDEEGKFCFAYNGKKDIVVVKTENGKAKKKKIHLKRKNSLYGGTICDNDGNYYVVTGKKNTTNDTSKNTVFITKYDSQGNEITTIGDNGSSSLAYYYDSSLYTKEPFHGGCCDLAINGDYLTVNYAREMYSLNNRIRLCNERNENRYWWRKWGSVDNRLWCKMADICR